ncbi:MAG: hypothetical protein K2M44_00600, partial [Clostridia bacterium]|nr:hypothetical protein [Clostridia bacterium]
MIVAAVATVCTLHISAPSDQVNPENEVQENQVLNTYGIKAPVYNNTNAAFMFAMRDADRPNMWFEILYPKTIYMDKIEDLADTGYYFRYHGLFQTNQTDRRVLITNNSIGDFETTSGSGTYVTPKKTSYSMNNLFSGYGFGTPKNISNLSNHTISGGQYDGNRYVVQIFNLQNTNTPYDVTMPLKGTLKNTSTPRTETIGIPGGRTAGNSSTQAYNKVIYDSVGGSNIYTINAFTDENDRNSNGGYATYFGNTSNGGYTNTYANWGEELAGSITIKIYDKSSLHSAITDLTSRYDALRSCGLTITNTTAYNTLKTNATNALQQREIEQSAINTQTTNVNNFKFTIATPSTTKEWTYGSVTAADAVKTAFGSGYSDSYFNVSVSGATSNVSNIFDVGSYSLTFVIKETNKYQFANNTSSASVNLTIKNANITVGSTANQNAVFTGNPQYFSTPPSGVTTVNNMTPSYTYSTSDSGPWQSRVSFTDAGTHKVFFKISANNHNDYIGSYNVVIAKANISLSLKNINSTYGDNFLGSNALIDNSVIDATTGSVSGLLGVTEIAAIRNKLKDMVTFKVVDGTQTLTDNLTNAGSYTISYDYKDNWGDNVSIIFAAGSNQSAYVISQKEISVTWKDKTSLKYDGAAGKRPDATIVSGDIVSGTTCTLNGV